MSKKIAEFAPRLNADIPKLPVPAKISITSFPSSPLGPIIENNADKTFEVVGLKSLFVLLK